MGRACRVLASDLPTSRFGQITVFLDWQKYFHFRLSTIMEIILDHFGSIGTIFFKIQTPSESYRARNTVSMQLSASKNNNAESVQLKLNSHVTIAWTFMHNGRLLVALFFVCFCLFYALTARRLFAL